MHTICTPSGQVLRIVIFKKNGVQAMVEYPFNVKVVLPICGMGLFDTIFTLS